MSKSDSDDDWFNKDENEILQSLESKVKKGETKSTDVNVEYIPGPSVAGQYLHQKRIETATKLSLPNNVKRITTETLRKALNMELLDLFLFATTSQPNFFIGQISASDGLDRVILYLRIWSRILELEVHSFLQDLLEKLAQNETFFEQLQLLATRVFYKTYKTIWKNEEEIDQILYAMKSLISRLHNAQRITSKISDVIRHIKKLINDSDYHDILCRNSSKQFLHELMLSEENVRQSEKVDIYPTLDELLTADSCSSSSPNPITDLFQGVDKIDVKLYIDTQKGILREDFIIPLREYIGQLKNSECVPTLTRGPALYEGVLIVLNTDFFNAKRHEMIFIDVLGNERATKIKTGKAPPDVRKPIKAIKTGSLLVLSTTKDFENLILAIVTYTDRELILSGFIGIEIIRQYNIGTVFNRPLLMFESPAFFEPYNNVYNYLNTYGDGDIPMKRYVIDGENNSHPPRYLKPEVSYVYEGQSFSVNTFTPPMLKKVPLNLSQMKAYFEALTNEFQLIQGPPGTGKTHLSVHLMRTLIENAKKPVVLITYTNDSLDKLLLKLSKYTSNILRFGSQTAFPEISKFNIKGFVDAENEMINPSLKHLYYLVNEEFKAKFQIVLQLQADFDGSEESYQQLQKAQKDVRNVAEKQKSIRLMFQFYVARKAGIIAMTTTCAAKSNFLFRLLQSKIVIFEEAGEILESHVLACLTPYTEHVIMIGDHMQLQPYTSSYHHSRKTHLNISLFERLFVKHSKGSTLCIQYRMRPSIADLIHPIFYPELKNHSSVESYPAVRFMLKNLYFYTHNECEEQHKDDCSIYNYFEIKEILNLAKYLIQKAKYTAGDIIILSPYKEQVDRLKKKVNLIVKTPNLNISTVDSFQGQEANIVLLSLVRSNAKGQIGFLQEKNRICVALSRAKHGLYVIGNMSLLSGSSATWRAIEQKLEAQNAIGNNFPFSINECSKTTKKKNKKKQNFLESVGGSW